MAVLLGRVLPLAVESSLICMRVPNSPAPEAWSISLYAAASRSGYFRSRVAPL